VLSIDNDHVWHDGDPVTAQDVATQLRIEEYVGHVIWSFINGIEVQDDSTLVFDIDEVGTLILDELEAALGRGVSIQLLMRPDLVSVLPEDIGERYRASLSEREHFRVRTSENVSGTFNLIDGNEVVIEVPHPLKAREVFAMIDLKDREFAASVREEFEPRWRDAEALSL